MVMEGFEPILPFSSFNRMGFAEVALHMPFFLRAKSYFVEQLRRTPPDVLVCVDYPGFNMVLLKEAHKLKIPVVWYIAPMVWAWKKKRAKVLSNLASHIAVIFPFEVPCFNRYTSAVTFVGNPTLEKLKSEGLLQSHPRKAPSKDKPLRLALLPGSRIQEIKKMLRPMLDAANIVKESYPNLEITVSRFNGFNSSIFKTSKFKGSIRVFPGPLRELLNDSDLALVTSGTASLETSLLGVPHVIAYRTSAINYAIFKKLVKIPHIGLPNIIAGKRLIPECIQSQASPEKMASELKKMIENRQHYEDTAKKLFDLRTILDKSNPSTALAQTIDTFRKNR